MLRQIIVLLFMFLIIVLIFLLGGSISTFFTNITLISVFGITSGIILVGFRPGEFFGSLFGKKDPDLNQLSVEFLGNAFMLAGASGSMIAFIQMLANLSNRDDLLSGLSNASMPFVMGFILMFVFHALRDESASYRNPDAEFSENIPISPVFSIIGIVIYFISIYTAMSSEFNVMLFVSVPSFMVTVVGGLAGFFVKNSWSDLKLALSGIFGYRYKNSVEARFAVRLNANLYNRITTFGLLGTIIGVSLMIRNLHDPNALGPGLALGLITSLYAAMIIIIINASGNAARRQLQWFGEDEKPNYLINPSAYMLITFGLILSALFLLLFSFELG